MRTLSATWAVGVLTALLFVGCGQEKPEALLESARLYMSKHDNKGAIIQIKNVLQQDSASAEARYLFGMALLESGDAEAASVELRKALDLKFPATRVVPLLARSLIVAQQNRKLVEQFGKVDFPDPQAQADLKTSMATAYEALGKPQMVQFAIEAALRAVPRFPPALMLQAKLAANQGQFAAAFALIDEVIASAPADAQAWTYRGEFLLMGKQDPKGAAASFERALNIRPDQIAARSNLISLLLSQRNLKDASRHIEALRKLLPQHPQTTFFDAELAFMSQQPKKALELIQQVAKVAPDDVNVLQLAASIELSNGSLISAERSLSKALLHAPGLSVARRRLADIYLRTGQPSRALTELQPLLLATVVDAQAQSLAGQAYLQTGDLEQAEASFLRATNVAPKDTKIRTLLAMTKLKEGRVDSAVNELRNIAASDAGTSADLALLTLDVRAKDFDGALKVIDAIEAKQPRAPLAPSLRGRLQLQLGNIEEARRNFERAIAIDPLFIPAAASLAEIDFKEKKPESAKKRFQAVLAVDPKNLSALLAMAKIREQEGASPSEVAALLANAGKLNPTESKPRLLLVNHFLAQRNFTSALAAAQDAAVAFPEDTPLLDALGRAQLARGDVNEAIASFNKLAALQPQSPDSQMRLAGLYITTKNNEAAKQSLRRALSITPDLLVAQQALFQIALSENRRQDAMDVAKQVQRQRPNVPAGFAMEAAQEVASHNLAAAAAIYRRLMQQFPLTQQAMKLHSVLLASGAEEEANKLAREWLAHHSKDSEFLVYLGDAAMARGRYEAAETQFRAALQLQPGNAAVMNIVAWIGATLHKPGAVALAERANKLKPNTPAFMDTMAAALAAENQIARAVDIERKAVVLAPSDTQLQLNLAKLNIQAGNKSAARAGLEALAKLGDRFQRQAEVDQLLKGL